MNKNVGIVDYGLAANLLSVSRAVEKVGGKAKFIRSAQDLVGLDRVILPGVGAFPAAIENLNRSGLLKPLIEKIGTVPTLGICLGAQLLATVGYEFEECKGFNFIRGEVREIPVRAALPHLGWAPVNVVRASPIFIDIPQNSQFYFMHSFELVNFTNVIGLSEYADHQFISAVQDRNIFGVQFHPEKSRENGLKLLENFLNLDS